MTTPPASGDEAPAPSGDQTPDPSTPPAPPKKSDFERLHDSKEEWKQKALAAEAEAERLRREKQAAEEAKLRENEDFKTLAEQKDAEAKARSDEAAAEKARADGLTAKVKAFEDQQEAELTALLDGMPEEKRPKLDPGDPVAKRLEFARYAQSLLSSGPKPHVGAGAQTGKDADRLAELKKTGLNSLTADDAMELAELSGS